MKVKEGVNERFKGTVYVVNVSSGLSKGTMNGTRTIKPAFIDIHSGQEAPVWTCKCKSEKRWPSSISLFFFFFAVSDRTI